MAKNSAHELKIYRRPSTCSRQPGLDSLGSLPGVLRAFREATGWQLRYAAGQKSRQTRRSGWSSAVTIGGRAVGRLLLEAPNDTTAAAGGAAGVTRGQIEEPAARQFASALGGMLTELVETRHALWQREAELAAGVPMAPHNDEKTHLAARLEAVIRGGAEAVGCDAAALYLLDETTSHLKLRSCWGLPLDRLVAPPRPLKGAVADLEALLGHAVVLEDAAHTPQWHAPEDFASAVCVPVSTPTTLLGTYWVFGNRKRDFSSQQTNLLEIVAGRVASDLEREMLLSETLAAARLKRELAAAERLQRNQLPTLSPLIDGWQLAGWASAAHGVGGAFYDWFCCPGGLLAMGLGRALDGGVDAALAAANLRTALRAHGQYHREPNDTLTQANLTLWTGTAGDQQADALFALLHTASGELSGAAGGQLGMLHVQAGRWQHVGHTTARLGEGPETAYRSFRQTLQPSEAMILFTRGISDATDHNGRPFGDAGLGEPAAGNPNLSAEALVELLTNRFLAHAAQPQADRALLVVRRTA